MTNTPHAVDWAIGQGANAVELDLEFTENRGSVSLDRFHHGPPCDCTCLCLVTRACRDSASVCNALKHDSFRPCDAGSSAQTLLNHVAGKSEIALVYIDSKVPTDWESSDQFVAGRKVVDALADWLFGNDYQGYVIIGAFREERLPYLKGAVQRASTSPFQDKMYFTYEPSTYSNADQAIPIMRYSLNTDKIIFGTGATACKKKDHSVANLEKAKEYKDAGRISMAYVWTDDARSTIRRDLGYVQGIITNYPSVVRDELRRAGKQLATQSSSIEPWE